MFYGFKKNHRTDCYWAKKDMTKVKGKLAHRITSYRAGYQPHERREIEEGLKSGKYLGVT